MGLQPIAMGQTPLPLLSPYQRIAASIETPVELWIWIHDAAIRAGREPVEAVRWADDRYWPPDLACDDPEVRSRTSPFPSSLRGLATALAEMQARAFPPDPDPRLIRHTVGL